MVLSISQFEITVFRFFGLGLLVAAVRLAEDDPDGAIWQDFHGRGALGLGRLGGTADVGKGKSGAVLLILIYASSSTSSLPRHLAGLARRFISRPCPLDCFLKPALGVL